MQKKEADIIYIKKRKIKHWVAVLIFLVAVLILININIKTVTVRGTKTYTDEQAVSMIFTDRWDYNTAYCLINKLLNRKKTLPFVSDYEINLTGPQTCELIIYEKNPVGCIKYMSSYMYFDSDGTVVESSSEKLDDIPVIEGVELGYIVLGEKLPTEDDELFSDIMNVTQQFSLYGISCDAIRFDELLNMTASLDGGDIKVMFGSNEEISAKISALRDMLPDIRDRGLQGSLDLRNYSDSSKGETVSFKISQE